MLYGIQGIFNRRISLRRNADRTDRLLGRAGAFDNHVEMEFEGPLAVVMGSVVSVSGGVLIVSTLIQMFAG